MIRDWKTLVVAVICLAASSLPAAGQSSSGSVLKVDVKNFAAYHNDVTDYTKLATAPDFTLTVPFKNFATFVTVADVIAVNGEPAKGTFVDRAAWFRLRPNPEPGQAIADTTRNLMVEFNVEILQPDGTPIGSIMATGMNGGDPPPGAPLESERGSFAIIGGTGAFVGVRGQGAFAHQIANNNRSVIEDPANRRAHGGASRSLILQLIPLSRPEVIVTSDGPSVFHTSDMTLVTSDNPAHSGEVLTLLAANLGPTKPSVDPGDLFTADPPNVVNSLLEVLVNGTSAEVLSAVGQPGSVNTYQVNFKLVGSVAGHKATLRLIAAWMSGDEVNIHTAEID